MRLKSTGCLGTPKAPKWSSISERITCPQRAARITLATPILGTQRITEVTKTEPSKPPIKIILGAVRILENVGKPDFRKNDATKRANRPVLKDTIAA